MSWDEECCLTASTSIHPRVCSVRTNQTCRHYAFPSYSTDKLTLNKTLDVDFFQNLRFSAYCGEQWCIICGVNSLVIFSSFCPVHGSANATFLWYFCQYVLVDWKCIVDGNLYTVPSSLDSILVAWLVIILIAQPGWSVPESPVGYLSFRLL